MQPRCALPPYLGRIDGVQGDPYAESESCKVRRVPTECTHRVIAGRHALWVGVHTVGVPIIQRLVPVHQMKHVQHRYALWRRIAKTEILVSFFLR